MLPHQKLVYKHRRNQPVLVPYGPPFYSPPEGSGFEEVRAPGWDQALGWRTAGGVATKKPVEELVEHTGDQLDTYEDLLRDLRVARLRLGKHLLISM